MIRNDNDIFLYSKELRTKWKNYKTLSVYTYSETSRLQCYSFLLSLLPKGPNKLEVTVYSDFTTNTLISIFDNKIDGVVIPYKSLERLLLAKKSKIKTILSELDFIILPISTFLSDTGVLDKDFKDSKTKRLLVGENVIEITREVRHPTIVNNQSIIRPHPLSFTAKKSFIGIPSDRVRSKVDKYVHDNLIEKKVLCPTLPSKPLCLFATSHYTLKTVQNNSPSSHILFSGGLSTWRKGAQEGLWFQGCSDGLGHEVITEIRESAVYQALTGQREWLVLSRTGASSPVGEVIGTYEYQLRNITPNYRSSMSQVEAFFWTSSKQAEVFMKEFPMYDWPDKVHACGLGKTYYGLKEMGLSPIPFVNHIHFLNWVENREDKVSNRTNIKFEIS